MIYGPRRNLPLLTPVCVTEHGRADLRVSSGVLGGPARYNAGVVVVSEVGIPPPPPPASSSRRGVAAVVGSVTGRSHAAPSPSPHSWVRAPPPLFHVSPTGQRIERKSILAELRNQW